MLKKIAFVLGFLSIYAGALISQEEYEHTPDPCEDIGVNLERAEDSLLAHLECDGSDKGFFAKYSLTENWTQDIGDVISGASPTALTMTSIAKAYFFVASRNDKNGVESLIRALAWASRIPESKRSEINFDVWLMLFEFYRDNINGILARLPSIQNELNLRMGIWQKTFDESYEIRRRELLADFHWERAVHLPANRQGEKTIHAERAVAIFDQLRPLPKAYIFLAEACANGFGTNKNVYLALSNLSRVLFGARGYERLGAIERPLAPEVEDKLSKSVKNLLEREPRYWKFAIGGFIQLWSHELARTRGQNIKSYPALLLVARLYADLQPVEAKVFFDGLYQDNPLARVILAANGQSSTTS